MTRNNKDGRTTRRGLIGSWGAALALGAALAAAGCVSTPAPPPPTDVTLSINAAPDINPGPAGRPAPVQVHIYWLRAPTTLQQADFFAVTEDPQGTLGEELVAHETVIVRPGQGANVQRRATRGEAYVGVVAAYRDLDAVVWRAVGRLAPNRQNVIGVNLARGGVSLSQQGPVAAAPGD